MSGGQTVMQRGKIQVIDGKYVRVVTKAYGEETVDRFTLEELFEFCKRRLRKEAGG